MLIVACRGSATHMHTSDTAAVLCDHAFSQEGSPSSRTISAEFVTVTLHFVLQVFCLGGSFCLGKTSDLNSFSPYCWFWPGKSREPEAGF